MGDVFRLFTGWHLVDLKMSIHVGMVPGKQKPVLYMIDENEKQVALAVFSNEQSVDKARMLLNKLGEGTNVKPI